MTLLLEDQAIATSLEPACPDDADTTVGSDRRQHPDRPLTAMVMGALTIIGSAAALVGAAGWADVHPVPFIAAGVAVLVAGLVVRSYVGGGRGMLPLGVPMLLIVSLIAITGPYLDDGIGARVSHPQSFGDLDDEYRFGVGNATIDLRDVDFPPGTHTVDVEAGIGHTIVWVPAGVDVDVVGDLEIGKLDVFGDTTDGFGNRLTAIESGDSDATLVLDVDMEIGHVEVRRG